MLRVCISMLSHESESGVLHNNHLPLSIGVISEFIKLNAAVPDLTVDIFKRPTLFESHIYHNDFDVVMFGNYMWNEKLNLYYASLAKKINPNVLVVLGGPNVSMVEASRAEFLRANRDIDLMVLGDGEIPSVEILETFSRSNLDIDAVKNAKLDNCLAYDHVDDTLLVGEPVDARLGVTRSSLDDIPSPYLSGTMDVLLEDGCIPLLESNRGCPYRCTYCQQGTSYFSKVRFFSGDRIGKELEYIAKKKQELGLSINIVEFADPNFGQYKQDLEVFNGIKRVQDEFGFPEQVWCSTGKSQANRIIEHAKLLKPGSIMIRAAMQSMNQDTLLTVERKNLATEVFENFSRDGVETYSDIMLALPMETFETYRNGILKLIDSNIDEFSMPQTLLLKGTPMEAQEYVEKFGIETKPRVIPECSGFYGPERQFVYEVENMVMTTSTLDFEGYLMCRQFALLVMIFHNTRLLKSIYKYMDYKKINRSELMLNIFNHSLVHSKFGMLLNQFKNLTKSELLETDVLPENVDIEELTSNKIYKFLSIALLQYHDALAEIFQEALRETITDREAIEFFSQMFRDVMILDLEHDRTNVVRNIPAGISGAFSHTTKTYEACLTEFQVERIDSLNTKYSVQEDRENKLPYHLRPSNMTKTIRFA